MTDELSISVTSRQKKEYAYITLFHEHDLVSDLNMWAEEGWVIAHIVDRPNWQNFSRAILEREVNG